MREAAVRGRGRRWAIRCRRRSIEALDALAADEYLTGKMGARLTEIFQEIKRYELDRWNAHLAKVTDWERNEYAHHL